MSKLQAWIPWGLFALVLIYLSALIFMAVFQRAFLFPAAPAWIGPENQNIPSLQAHRLRTRDGTLLAGWFIPPARPDSMVYLYFHGNADGLDKRSGRFAIMTKNGDGLLAMSYRGYGGSGGEPSEQALLSDAEEIYLEISRKMPAERIVIVGESLGTGVALHLAQNHPARAVILDSPYLSILHRAQSTYPWLPVSFILKDTFRSDLRIANVRMPILILHGTADDFIPPSDSEALAARAQPGIVTRKLYPGQPHVVPFDQGPWNDIPAFLAKAQLGG